MHHVLHHRGTNDTFLCKYWTQQGFQAVTSADLITAIWLLVIVHRLDKAGINPDLIGVHSLQAGGAMALKLHGASDTTIMKMGWWSSLTFLIYIHNQIRHLSKDLSAKMNCPVLFLNIATIKS